MTEQNSDDVLSRKFIVETSLQVFVSSIHQHVVLRGLMLSAILCTLPLAASGSSPPPPSTLTAVGFGTARFDYPVNSQDCVQDVVVYVVYNADTQLWNANIAPIGTSLCNPSLEGAFSVPFWGNAPMAPWPCTNDATLRQVTCTAAENPQNVMTLSRHGAAELGLEDFRLSEFTSNPIGPDMFVQGVLQSARA